MKAVLIIVLLISSMNLEANDNNDKSKIDNYEKVGKLIDQGLSINYDSIQTASKELDNSERLMLFKNNKKAIGYPALASMVPVLSLGSFMQENYVAGFIFAGAQVYGLSKIMESVTTGFISAQFGAEPEEAKGTFLFPTAYFIGIIFPVIYGEAYNIKLKNALGITNDDVSFDLRPMMNITSLNTPSYGFNLSVRF